MIPPTLLFLASMFLQEPSEIYRFDFEVNTVYVDVFVTKDGAPVANLEPSRFALFDNGVRQEIELVTQDVMPLSTMLVLDISGSVAGAKLNDLRAAAHAFIDGLEPRDEVGLISFARRMDLLSAVSSDFPTVHRALDQPMTAGETGLNDALFAALSLLSKRGGRPLILVFSDGLENTSWLTTSEVLEVVAASQAVIHAVSVTTPQPAARALVGRARKQRGAMVVASSYLEALTKSTGGRVWSAASTAELRGIYLSILEEMKSRYLISYQPRGVPLPGTHELRVDVKGYKGDEVRARSQYQVQR